MTVWENLVGQERVVEQLSVASTAATATAGAAGTGMTHAWLLTGPPGSGRSTAARAFAAALQCERGGCGHCGTCHTVLAGTHADVEVVSTEVLSIGVKDTRALVRRASLVPVGGRWQVLIMEDADRLTESAGNVLLKAIEEPAARTVWMLCSPSLEDVLPTIRSRCRHVLLRTPPARAVADVLVRRDGVDSVMAGFAARAAQGHIGRAMRLATDEQARLRRQEVLRLPTAVTDAGAGVGDCLVAAGNLVDAVVREAKQASEELNQRETEELKTALGLGGTRRSMPGTAGALKELEGRQKKRATRLQRDALDRALVDLAAFYRDVLAVQLGAGVELINDEMRPAIGELATSSAPLATLRRIEAVLACRKAIAANVAQLLAVESMAVSLREGDLARGCPPVTGLAGPRQDRQTG